LTILVAARLRRVSKKDETTGALRKWVEIWKGTGVIFRKIPRQELRRLDATEVR
jgi:hypothetical protein